MAEFVMPQLGADMNAGKLLRWRKNVGDRVKRGDIIADVETEKADIEVEVFSTGVIEKFLVEPGISVPIGTPLAVILEEGRAGAKEAAPLPAPPVGAPETSPVPPGPVVSMATPEPGRLRISPAARKLAIDLGIDTSHIAGTGPGGRVTLEDVRQAAEQKPTPQGGPPVSDRAERMQQIIASAMARSKREIPHYYLSTTVDMFRAMTWLGQENLKRSVENRLVYGVLLLKATALALRSVPELNARWVGTKVAPIPDIHVGVAISLRGGGLVAPALHYTDAQSLDELMKNFRDLVLRARAGSLRSSEMSDPTITVTSLGEQGVETVFGIIYPPQVALVGFGKIVDRPWSSEGQIVSRPVLTATLSGDHRVSDGHRGGLFLSDLERLLQEPDRL